MIIFLTTATVIIIATKKTTSLGKVGKWLIVNI